MYVVWVATSVTIFKRIQFTQQYMHGRWYNCHHVQDNHFKTSKQQKCWNVFVRLKKPTFLLLPSNVQVSSLKCLYIDEATQNWFVEMNFDKQIHRCLFWKSNFVFEVWSYKCTKAQTILNHAKINILKYAFLNMIVDWVTPTAKRDTITLCKTCSRTFIAVI